MLNFNLFWGCIQGRPQNISLSALKSYYFLSWGKSMTENFWISWFDRKSVCIPPMQASWQDYRYQVHSRFLNKSRYICGVSGFCFDRISHILFVWSIERQNIMKGYLGLTQGSSKLLWIHNVVMFLVQTASALSPPVTLIHTLVPLDLTLKHQDHSDGVGECI